MNPDLFDALDELVIELMASEEIDIAELIDSEQLTIDDIVSLFRECLEDHLGLSC